MNFSKLFALEHERKQEQDHWESVRNQEQELNRLRERELCKRIGHIFHLKDDYLPNQYESFSFSKQFVFLDFSNPEWDRFDNPSYLATLKKITFACDPENPENLELGKPIDTDTMYDTYARENFLILKTGYLSEDLTGQSVSLLFIDKFFIFIDRNHDSYRIYNFNKLQFSKETLKKIVGLISNAHSYKEMLSSILKVMETIEITVDLLISHLQNTIKALPKQITGNCIWASTEGAVHVFFCFKEMQRLGFFESNQLEMRTNIINRGIGSGNTIFNNWLNMQKISILHEYIRFHNEPTNKININIDMMKSCLEDYNFIDIPSTKN